MVVTLSFLIENRDGKPKETAERPRGQDETTGEETKWKKE